jgi:hypothetical protein
LEAALIQIRVRVPIQYVNPLVGFVALVVLAGLVVLLLEVLAVLALYHGLAVAIRGERHCRDRQT